MFLLLILCAGFGETKGGFAQTLVSQQLFSLSCPYREPDGRIELIKISDTDFITLSKTKGNLTGRKSLYLLERYDLNLVPKWKTRLTVEKYEDHKDLIYHNGEIVLLSVVHNHDQYFSKLFVYGFDLKKGKKIWYKELDSVAVEKWQNAYSKGSVKETFQDLINSGIRKNFITPLQYEYYTGFSPDKKKFIAWRYDYSKERLYANVKIFDNRFEKINEAVIPLDNYANYGIFLNNPGDIYILNADATGRIIVIQYDLTTKESNLLEIERTNNSREDFKLLIVDDKIVYVANLNLLDNQLIGVMYSRFNFETSEVEEINFYEISQDLVKRIDSARQQETSLYGPESWMNYEIAGFRINQNGGALFVLENRYMSLYGYLYIKSLKNISNWYERSALIKTEGILIFSFDSTGQLKWENFHLKSQVNAAYDGLNSVSFVAENFKDKLSFLYASSDITLSGLNKIELVEFDKHTGEKIKHMSLPNEFKLTLVRAYSFWPDQQNLIIVGKKGVMGRRSLISRFELN
ncbi:MAG: hypothetical protein FVQ77_07005 [Cytophagales bacterium]|nr:hypothetical protein [Cytophagales bacterium]